MRLHDGRIINVNETVRNLGNECKPSSHASPTGYDTVSYPYRKGKITAANLLLKMNRNLEQMCDDQNSNRSDWQVWHRLFGMFIIMKASQGIVITTFDVACFANEKSPPKIKCFQLVNLQFTM